MSAGSSHKIDATKSAVVRVGGSLCLLLIFLLLIWNAARGGFASLLYTYAARTNQIAAADAAVKLAPNDPEAHFLRAALLEANSDLPAVIGEYQKAAQLRPDDYVLWLNLARARELNGEMDQALAAARQAVPLAPYYAQPHWQLGNLLVRAGQREEGFKELRLAAASDPTLLPGIIDLAWQLSRGDVKSVEQDIEPQSAESYKALAEYFRKHGEVAEATRMFGAAGNDAEVLRAREQYVNELISAKRFKDAYELWSIGRGLSSSGALGAIVDPGFEQESNLDEPGFGWRATVRAPSLALSLDSSNPREGRSSLRVDFNGESNANAPIISQLVLVLPRTQYQLRLAFRTEDLVSGGRPGVLITDPSDNKVLGQTGALPQTTEGWRETKIDFTTGESTTTIQIALQREPCGTTQCPIFGRLWLDDFELKKL